MDKCPCPLCDECCTVYVINFKEEAIEEAVLKFEKGGVCTIKTKSKMAQFEIIDLDRDCVYDTPEEANRALFKFKLEGKFLK